MPDVSNVQAGPAKPEGYPATTELDKMLAAKSQSQPAGEFLDWLFSEGYALVKFGEYGEVAAHHPGIEALLAGWQGIDLQKIETERRAVLEYARRMNG